MFLILKTVGIFCSLSIREIWGKGGPRAYFVLIATAPLQFAFSFGIIQAVAAVAVFFFIYVGDPKHLLSQTQKFNKVFLRKNEKMAVLEE